MDLIIIIALLVAGCTAAAVIFTALDRGNAPETPGKEKSRDLSGGMKRIAWGFLLIYLDVNLGTIDILPNWLGFCLLVWALPAVAKEEPSAILLRPLGILLAIWEGVLWAAAALGQEVNSYLITAVMAVLSLYFYFQLLTNLANVAKKYDCPQEKQILTLRTVQTILTTLTVLPLPWQEYEAAIVAIALVQCFAALWLCCLMFALRKSLTADSVEGE